MRVRDAATHVKIIVVIAFCADASMVVTNLAADFTFPAFVIQVQPPRIRAPHTIHLTRIRGITRFTFFNSARGAFRLIGQIKIVIAYTTIVRIGALLAIRGASITFAGIQKKFGFTNEAGNFIFLIRNAILAIVNIFLAIHTLNNLATSSILNFHLE